MAAEIINRVEKSGLVQIDLDEFYPQGKRVEVDLKDFLFNGLVLKEQEFRAQVKKTDWSLYQGAYVALNCSVDAIIPLWAYMLIVVHLKPHAIVVSLGDFNDLEKKIFAGLFETLDFHIYQDKNVIVKGCGKYPIPEAVFIDFVMRLQGFAKNIMFGEACSAVPLFKRKQ